MKPDANELILKKTTLRTLIYTILTIGIYSVMHGCDKPSPDIKSKLTDHKIISLTDSAELSDNGENPLEGNSEAISNGSKHYASMCAVCHGKDARGDLAPNLVDDTSLHGSDNFTIFHILMNGIQIEKMKMRPPHGKMPGYKNILGPHRLLEIMAWISSQKN